MIALDTTAIIDLFKGDKDIEKVLSDADAPFVSTHLNYLELMMGIKELNKGKEEAYYDKLFSDLITYNLSLKSSKKASEIFNYLKKKGKMVEPFDCTIAAILLTEGVNKIITKNVKHFSLIPGLKVLSY